MRDAAFPAIFQRKFMALPIRLLTLWLAILWCAAPPLEVLAQTSGKQVTSPLNALQRLQSTVPEAPVAPPAWVDQEPTAMEAPVDPALYRMEPGDRLHLGIWGEVPLGYYTTVTPEGDLIIPSVGPVRVTGQTLQQAEAIVAGALRKYYPGDRITLRLLQPGKFRVVVTGMVGHPGMFDATGLDRISTALELAGGIRPGGSIRAVRTWQSGDTARAADSQIDLLPWVLHGDRSANPNLTPGMIVDVPSQGRTVRIRGPVNGRSAIEIPTAAPVRIGDRPEEEPDLVLEWREGDTVGDLLDQVGGLSERATGNGVLRRQGAGPQALDLRIDQGRSVKLQAGDVVDVVYTARWVFVIGAVRAPGRYPFLPGLTVRDYVFMAGGPTELGRATGWTLQLADQPQKKISHLEEVAPGWTIRVPERRTYKLSTLLSPLSSATALVISLVALTRRR